MSAILNNLSRIPAPIFGNMGTALRFARQKAQAAPRYAAWAVPGVIGAAWFVYPAVGDETKIILGIIKDPELVKAEVELRLAQEAEMQLDMDKVKGATMPAAAKPLSLAKRKELAREAIGDFSHLEKHWDKFMNDAVHGDEDDDDDEEDEDDEDEEEDGDEEEGEGDEDEEDEDED